MSITLNGTSGITAPTYNGTVSAEYSVPVTAFKNRIINGNFDIWQRGTSSTATGYTCADRWKFDVLTAVTASQGNAAAPYGTYYLSLTPSNATNSVVVAQTLESNNLVSLKGSDATLSFQGNCASGTVSVTAYIQKSATANDSTGGGGGWATVSSQVFTLSTLVQKFSLTGAIPNDGTANGLRVAFAITNSANGVAYGLWQSQLDKGSTATSFDFRPYSTELALCQRYYEAGTNFQAQGYSNTATSICGFRSFKTSMRAIPTIAFSSTSYVSATGLTLLTSSLDGFSAVATGTSVGGNSYFFTGWTASAEL